MSKKIIENFENHNLITAFKNFNLRKDNALVLIAPENDIIIFDNILYNNCYLKMFNQGASEKNY